MKKIKKLGVLSVGKTMGSIYASLGLLFGGLISIFSVLGGALISKESNMGGVFVGIGAIIFFPVLYGGLGFLFGLLTGWLYNLVARWTGGIEIELSDSEEKIAEK